MCCCLVRVETFCLLCLGANQQLHLKNDGALALSMSPNSAVLAERHGT